MISFGVPSFLLSEWAQENVYCPELLYSSNFLGTIFVYLNRVIVRVSLPILGFSYNAKINTTHLEYPRNRCKKNPVDKDGVCIIQISNIHVTNIYNNRCAYCFRRAFLFSVFVLSDRSGLPLQRSLWFRYQRQLVFSTRRTALLIFPSSIGYVFAKVRIPLSQAM